MAAVETAPDLNNQLLAAAHANDLVLVTRLLQQGANADYRFHEDGTWGACKDDTPLHGALLASNVEMAKLLLQHGAKLDAKVGSTDWRGCGRRQSLFEIAVASPSLEMLEVCLPYSTLEQVRVVSTSSTHSMRTDGSSKHTVLNAALDIRAWRKAMLLLKAGADPNGRHTSRYSNERGYHRRSNITPLHQVCQSTPDTQADLSELSQMIYLITQLVLKGADINALSDFTVHETNPGAKDSKTDDPRADGYISPVICVQHTQAPLHAALAAGGHPWIVFTLLMLGANPTLPVKIGQTEKPMDEFVNSQQNLPTASVELLRSPPSRDTVMKELMDTAQLPRVLADLVIQELLGTPVLLE